MSYYVWIIINAVFVCTILTYTFAFRDQTSLSVTIGQLMAVLAVILFLVNLNMYVVFLLIRSIQSRPLKIALARFSRVMMRYHIHLAIAGTAFILLHAIIMLAKAGPLTGFMHVKWLSGFVGVLALCITLFAGYLRHRRSSGPRRRFHLVSAIAFGVIFCLHLFWPLP